MEHRSYSQSDATMLTPRHAKGILDAMRARRAIVRKQRYRSSKLTRYRAELVTLCLAGPATGSLPSGCAETTACASTRPRSADT
jgi:predicted anti-sigma-YlaC factor YlaD